MSRFALVYGPDHPDVVEGVELYASGWTCAEIERWFGWTRNSAWMRLKRAGVVMRKAKKRGGLRAHRRGERCVRQRLGLV